MAERTEDLQCDGLKIIQDSSLYTFSSDSVILANFVRAKKGVVAVEIGAGSGVVSILVQAKTAVKKIFAFEIQSEMARLAKKNVCLNNLCEKIEIIEDDVKNHKKYLKNGEIDVVFSNPPYFKCTNFHQSDVKKIAKEEVFLDCKALCESASQMLKSGGDFFVVYPAERCCQLICQLQANKLTPKEMFFTENGKGKVKLFVVRATKDGKDGCKVLPNLVTNDGNGQYLEKLKTKNFK